MKKPERIGCWELGEDLGRGSFATVWKCYHVETRAVYACKGVKKSNIQSEGDAQRFQREINTMAFLRHDSLVALHDFLFDEENFYMVIDYADGGELFDYIVKNDKLSEPDAAVIFQQIAEGVAYAHSFGVAHRDLKPENVLICRFPRVKVADFGLCGFMSDQELMKTFCGSPVYCAPECLCRVQYDGKKADVWSLGVILFAMVTGEHPWNVSNTACMLRQIVRGSYKVPEYVTPRCRELIQGCMRVEPMQRMTMAQVLRHPWFQCAARSRYAQAPGFRLELPDIPELQSVSLEDLSEQSARAATIKDEGSGIFSPFQHPPGAAGSGLPGLNVRSASVERFNLRQEAATANAPGSQAGTSSAGGSGLAGARQKSQVNLVQKKAAGGRRAMPVIGED